MNASSPAAQVLLVDANDEARLLFQLAFDELLPHLPVLYLSGGEEAAQYVHPCLEPPVLLVTMARATPLTCPRWMVRY